MNQLEIIKQLQTDVPCAIIFIGIPASGKSTFFRKYLAETHVHINLDTLKTRHREKLLLDDCLADNQSFVVDNTNTQKTERAKYIAAAKAQNYRIVGLFFQSKIKDSKERNAGRVGKAKVPDIAIYSMFQKLEYPAYTEGFDALYFIKIENNDFVIESWKTEGGLS